MTETHIMLDIESLGLRPGFIVLSAAFVRFNDLATTSCALSQTDQLALGLEADRDTINWWRTQTPEAIAAATANPIPLAAALQHYAAWLAWAAPGGALIWCHGASFDAPLLGEVYRRAGIACPWTFRNVRDTRTLYDLAGVDPKAFATGSAHVALDDAIGQTHAAVEALRRLAQATRAAVA